MFANQRISTIVSQLFRSFLLLSITCLLFVQPLHAQQGNVWVFGFNAILDFNTTPPTPSSASAMGQTEGCASIADINGDLLFYTDGIRVWNKNHAQMANGFGLLGNPSATQSAVIVPKPGSNTIYYIFTVPAVGGFTSGDFYYTEVDMSLNGGLGDVVATTKNTFILAGVSERVTAVQHSNGSSFWIITHVGNTASYYAYELSSTGLNTTPVVSTLGISTTSSIGYLKASPQGDKIAVAHWSSLSSLFLFDFNNSTGVLSNFKDLSGTFTSVYGVEFSPSGQYLYSGVLGGFGTGGIEQFDTNLPTAAAMTANKYSVSSLSAAALQLAPDGKIYVTYFSASNLHVINDPDVGGVGCNFVANGQPLATGSTSSLGLPTFVQSFFNPNTGIAINDTCFMDTTQFLLTGVVPDSVFWTFGDPASGTADTSTSFSPTHVYTDTGFFNISVVAQYVDTLNNSLVIDTLFDTLYIHPIPQADLGNDTVLCTGDTLPYNLVGGDFNYLWSDSSTSTSLNITQVGTYWLEVSNLCGVASDTVTVDSIYFVDVIFPNDTLLCDGDSISVDAWVPFGTYLWHDSTIADTTSSLTITTTGFYWAEASNLCGVDSDSIFVEFEVPPVTMLPNDTAMCTGSTITPNVAFSRATYLWSDGSTDSTLTIATPNTYWVEVTNLCGVDSDTMDVHYDFPLNINLGPDTVVCVGNSYTLAPPTAGAAMLWQDSSTDTSMLVDAVGTYWLEATNLCGVYTDTLDVDYEIPPTVNLGNDLQFCTGDTASYDVTFSRASYLWSHGPVTPTVDLTLNNNYSVTVTNLCGTTTDDINISIDFPVDPDLGPNQILCQGDEWTLDGTQPHRASYIWNTGDTVPIITTMASGFYWLKMENTCGVFGDTITLNFQAPPKLNFPETVVICGDEGPGNPYLIRPEESATGYLWQDGSQGTKLLATTEGLYWLEASNRCGTSRDSLQLVYEPLPVIDLGSDTFLCAQNGPLAWDISQFGASYLWQDGTTSPTYQPDAPGLYFATITDENGCENTDEVMVQECPVFVYVPNAFSPNNDRKNDVFKAEGELLIRFELKVFNRWGELLWETTDINKGWDGTVNGQLSPIGTYVYSLFYQGENTGEITTSGSFSLIK